MIDELYASAPDEFTAERNAAAKRLDAEGDREAAAKVKALRKPTQIAWVLNQLARRHPDDVEALVDVGRALRRSSDLRETIARQRTAIRTLTTKTEALMRDLGVSPAGHLDEIAGALQAALVDPAVGAQLVEGRFEKVPAPAASFPGTMPVPAAPASPPKVKTSAKESAKREEARTAAQNAQTRADALNAQAVEMRRTATEVRADARRLAEEARKLMAEARRVSAQAHARKKEADRAEAQAKKADAEATKAEREAKRLATKARER